MTLADSREAPGDVELDVRPLSGHTGAEIVGVDLRAPLSAGMAAQVRAALLRWKVVFLRDQEIGQDEHLAFARSLGTPSVHPTQAKPFPDHPEIGLLEHLPDQPEAQNRENRWHTDVTFTPDPPAMSILRGVVVPPYGGDTQWTNLVTAYETLSPLLRQLVDQLHAVHDNTMPQRRGETSARAKALAPRQLRAVHPVVRVHPETGERALFVNPGFTSHILELSRPESDHLLGLLFEHLTKPRFTARFRWTPGSIAVWDNRATAHLVPSDVPADCTRSMQRITIAGDRSVGVDGALAYTLED